ncbi:hypothetical protein ACFL1V_02410 [Pseudomonadota bacterium]
MFKLRAPPKHWISVTAPVFAVALLWAGGQPGREPHPSGQPGRKREPGGGRDQRYP